MNKKGSFDVAAETMLWIARVIFLVVVVFAIVFVVNLFISRDFDIKDLEISVTNGRFLYDCFLYEDQRIYPGIIDKIKFNDDSLKKCLAKDENYYRLSLNNSNLTIYNVDKKNFNEEWWLCRISRRCYNEKFIVRVYDEGFYDDLLIIDRVRINE